MNRRVWLISLAIIVAFLGACLLLVAASRPAVGQTMPPYSYWEDAQSFDCTNINGGDCYGTGVGRVRVDGDGGQWSGAYWKAVLDVGDVLDGLHYLAMVYTVEANTGMLWNSGTCVDKGMTIGNTYYILASGIETTLRSQTIAYLDALGYTEVPGVTGSNWDDASVSGTVYPLYCNPTGSAYFIANDVQILYHDVNMPPTPTPSPTPSGGSLWGLECEYVDTGGITQTISANLFDNGSFESGTSGWSSVSQSGGNYLPGGYWSTIGPASGDYAWRYATGGSYSLFKLYTDDQNGRTVLKQDIYLNRAAIGGVGVIYLDFGMDVIPAENGEPGGCRGVGIGKDLDFNNQVNVCTPVDPWVSTWQHVSASAVSVGGGFSAGIGVGPGESGVYVDRAYLYARRDNAQGEIICPSPDVLGTPTPVATVDAIPTLGATPTMGPILGTPAPPGVEIVPKPTACLGWGETEISQISQTIPAFSICAEPSQVTFDEDNPLGELLDLNATVSLLFTAVVGAVIVQWVRRR